MELTLKMEVEIPEKLLGDLLVTAFDGAHGGCWFWCHSDGDYQINERFVMDDPENVLSIWRKVQIVTDEEDDAYAVDHSNLASGMQLIMNQPKGKYNKLKALIGEAVMNDDAGVLDANDADTIVQFALFGEEVYG